MKSISILGTTSDAGKSWLNTAFCALMRKHGVNVAPFKAQNMSNNSFVTLEGGEIGRAQAAQAEACGLRPIAEMNPVLLKPSGDSTSQVVQLGKPGPHVKAGSYYKDIEEYRDLVRDTLDWWKSRCDLLLLEGAGSPVELNLMNRDVVNLFPVEYLDGKWILAADIERGGVFAQAIGTVDLMPETDRQRGLGIVVNKFRGDPKLFNGAEQFFRKHIKTPYLGVLPMRYDLQPETEDGFSLKPDIDGKEGLPLVAWVCFPRISNSQDMQPWTLDKGVQVRWVRTARALEQASVIVLPGSKNTIADLEWLKTSGLAEVIQRKAKAGTPVLGICGGFQMLGERLIDPSGIAGQEGEVQGLGLLPIETIFEQEKRVTQVEAIWGEHAWSAYEIHMGVTRVLEDATKAEHLLKIKEGDQVSPEGVHNGNVFGTYLHGFFESAVTREFLCRSAGIAEHQAVIQNWNEYKQNIYSQMAELLEENLNLEGVFKYVGL